jgi:hypothetical protein
MAQPDSDFGDTIGRQKFTPSATAAIGFADGVANGVRLLWLPSRKVT